MFCLKGKCVCVRSTDVFAWGVNTGVCVCGTSPPRLSETKKS